MVISPKRAYIRQAGIYTYEKQTIMNQQMKCAITKTTVPYYICSFFRRFNCYQQLFVSGFTLYHTKRPSSDFLYIKLRVYIL